ncbi:SDR family NAD(P)-dependent oxidoreductase [Sphingomonas crocodyli]|nr:SDR family NAD(P)-dependent oxidoreductase [Sphingomonas crocodyli]
MAERVALVTGGNVGIGHEVVRALAKAGHVVWLASRDADKGKKAAADLAGEGDIRPVRIDVTDEASMVAAVAAIEAAHGKLDLLINNAGATFGGGAAHVADLDALRAAIENNAIGPLRMSQLALPLLRKGETAQIIMVGSGAGSLAWLGNPAPGFEGRIPLGYATSKSVMHSISVQLAQALKADRIAVNVISPGYVNSAVSQYQGTKSTAEGAAPIVRLALDPAPPTGRFISDVEGQELPW